MTLFNALLIIHIIAGIICLVLGPSAFILINKIKAHRTVGKIYVKAMFVICVTALMMSFVGSMNPFLLYISLFSFYNVLTGMRALKFKKSVELQPIRKVDWLISVTNFILSMVMVGFGIFTVSKSPGMAYLCIGFGVFGTIRSLIDFRRYRLKERYRGMWVISHGGGMGGSLIATTTAFLVNTADFLPDLVNWFGPTIILSPILSILIRKYMNKNFPRRTIKSQA